MTERQKLTIINNSSMSGIPGDIIDIIGFNTLDQANSVLHEYSLRISEYEKVFDAGNLVEERITLVDL